MGQKSNVQTLRFPAKNNLLTTININNPKYNLLLVLFIKSIDVIFKKRNIFLINTIILFSGNRLKLKLNFFFGTSKIIRLKKKKFKSFNKKKNSFTCLNRILKKLVCKFKLNSLTVVLCNLNVKLDSKLLTFFYIKFKTYINLLFNKRFYLYLDFIKVLCLLKKNFNLTLLLSFLAEIFCFLSKKTHVQFISFLTQVFNIFFALKKDQRILGVKLLINGKIKGADRASSEIIKVGDINIQALKQNLLFDVQHIYTRYGVFGLRAWVTLSEVN